MACAGDIPTMESLAAVAILKEHFSDLKIRFVNVVDLFRLMPATEHPHGLSDRDFDSLFTATSRSSSTSFLSFAHSQAKLPAQESRQFPRARIQGKGQHQIHRSNLQF